MSFTLTRILAYFTLFSYLIIGSIAVRILMPEMTTVTISNNYLSLFEKTEVQVTEVEAVLVPEIKFAAIQFPVEKKVVARKVIAKVNELAKPQQVAELKVVAVAKNELPFYEPVVLGAVTMNEQLPQNMASLYKDFYFENIAATPAIVEDQISMKLAQAEKPMTEAESDPTFFEYDTDEKVTAKNETDKTEISTTAEVINNVDNVNDVNNAPEEVAIEDLVAFDYSKAREDLKQETIPTVSKVTTHYGSTQPVAGFAVAPPLISKPTVVQESIAPVAPRVSTQRVVRSKPQNIVNKSGDSSFVPDQETDDNSSSFMSALEADASSSPSRSHYGSVTIKVAATNLRQTKNETGFEIRFNDDLSGREVVQDFGSGSILLEQEMTSAKMTRSISVLKPGFAPTNYEAIIEEGASEESVPLFDESKFNKLMSPYKSLGHIGMVLVALGDDVETATLDVPYTKVLHLDENLRSTDGGEYHYQLFIGVKAGNAFLTYRGMDEEVVSKIIHVHSNELTYDGYEVEDVKNERVRLFEEDLLAKEKAPLVISSEQVRVFATDKISKKVNDHTYKLNFGKVLFGGRRYLELSHQSEPVFVGLKDKNTAIVPSENFMRYILSRFEGSKLGNRCLVQVNLSKKASGVDVASESVDKSLDTFTQILDKDGKFYDSVSDNSRKIIIIGENNGTAPEFSQDAKINIKITYQDGSVEYLGSYCSPNSYLVEQL